MSFLRHVQACNRWQAARFLPLRLRGARLGFVRHDHAALLRKFPALFVVETDAVTIEPGQGAAASPDGLSARMGELGAALAQDGAVRLRGEEFDVRFAWGGPVQFRLDRGSSRFWACARYGVHLNGTFLDGRRRMLWIARRAADRLVAPGKLDNLVGGGIGAGHDAAGTLAKEAREEAGIEPALIARARAATALAYRMEIAEGMRDDVLFVYDLETPEDFAPRNSDGEIAEFRPLPLEACLDEVRSGDAFKFNVNLVVLDFAIRHGVIGPDDPDYLDLVSGLRAGLAVEAEPRAEFGR